MKKYISMKKKITMILLIVSMYLMVGCEDVITYELDSSEPQMVIDASITDSPNSGIVQLSWSTDYFNPGSFENVSNAVVTIIDDNGNVYNLLEESPGTYKRDNININYNQNYELRIVAEDVTYNASTTLVEPLIIDSLSYSFESFFGEEYCDVFIHFQDPEETKEFAIIYVKRNDDDYEFPILYEDRLTNGNYFKESLIQIPKEELLSGKNTVEFFMRTVNEETYNYYKSLSTVLASDQNGALFSPSSPENPKSNFNNEVLGFFAGYSVSKKTIEIINN